MAQLTEDEFYAARAEMLRLHGLCGSDMAKGLIMNAVLYLTRAQAEEFPGGACAIVVRCQLGDGTEPPRTPRLQKLLDVAAAQAGVSVAGYQDICARA